MMNAQARLTSNEDSTGLGENYAFELVKSWRSFKKHFDDATKVRAVTYSDSPELLLDCFEKFDLERLEVVVGNVKDYRERLVNEENLADKLEKLKRDGSLIIYTPENKNQLHSKLYLIERGNEKVKIIVGSPNFTKNGWEGRQKNYITVFNTKKGSKVEREVTQHYKKHKDYCKPFLEDLSEKIENSDEPREEVVRKYVEGKLGGQESETDKFLVNMTEEAMDTEKPADEEIRLSLRGYDEKDSIKNMVGDFDTSPSKTEVRMSPAKISKFTRKNLGNTLMKIDEENGIVLTTPNGRKNLTSIPPEDDPSQIDDALQNIERYFETVDKFGDCKNPEATKAHMFEALLYFLWAPFVNIHAETYRNHNISLDKRLPFLYIYGEPSSGKGTFVKFALSLISKDLVTDPIDGDEVGKKDIRNLRRTNTCFPAVIDDIGKNKVSRFTPLRNYWKSWSGGRYPVAVFTSNDERPKEWFRDRAKIIRFNVRFESTMKGESMVKDIMNVPNPVFEWFSYLYLSSKIELEDDPLAKSRRTFKKLYDLAERPLPNYFPDGPAEEKYDIGREKWIRAKKKGIFTEKESDGNLILKFNDDMERFDVSPYYRDLPGRTRAKQEGNRIEIRNPKEYHDWLGEPGAERSGILNKFKSLIKGGRK